MLGFRRFLHHRGFGGLRLSGFLLGGGLCRLGFFLLSGGFGLFGFDLFHNRGFDLRVLHDRRFDLHFLCGGDFFLLDLGVLHVQVRLFFRHRGFGLLRQLDLFVFRFGDRQLRLLAFIGGGRLFGLFDLHGGGGLRFLHLGSRRFFDDGLSRGHAVQQLHDYDFVRQHDGQLDLVKVPQRLDPVIAVILFGDLHQAHLGAVVVDEADFLDLFDFDIEAGAFDDIAQQGLAAENIGGRHGGFVRHRRCHVLNHEVIIQVQGIGIQRPCVQIEVQSAIDLQPIHGEGGIVLNLQRRRFLIASIRVLVFDLTAH